jgi:hypothetical protein
MKIRYPLVGAVVLLVALLTPTLIAAGERNNKKNDSSRKWFAFSCGFGATFLKEIGYESKNGSLFNLTFSFLPLSNLALDIDGQTSVLIPPKEPIKFAILIRGRYIFIYSSWLRPYIFGGVGVGMINHHDYYPPPDFMETDDVAGPLVLNSGVGLSLWPTRRFFISLENSVSYANPHKVSKHTFFVNIILKAGFTI